MPITLDIFKILTRENVERRWNAAKLKRCWQQFFHLFSGQKLYQRADINRNSWRTAKNSTILSDDSVWIKRKKTALNNNKCNVSDFNEVRLFLLMYKYSFYFIFYLQFFLYLNLVEINIIFEYEKIDGCQDFGLMKKGGGRKENFQSIEVRARAHRT